MAPYIAGLRARLVALRYTPDSIKVMLSLFGRLGRWMDDANVEVARLDEAAIASPWWMSTRLMPYGCTGKQRWLRAPFREPPQ